MYTTDDERTTIRPGMVIVFGLMLGAIGTSIYFFLQFRQTRQEILQLKQTTVTNVSLSDKKKLILSDLGKIVELPPNEEPSLATISDVTKLVDQPFFANAHNGDEVIVYKQSKKAIIYNPTTKKIVDMAQVNLDNTQLNDAPNGASPSATEIP